jgi:hypothetical protein
MLAALNITAVGLGLGAGGLSATFIALLIGGGLSLAGVESGADIGLVIGIGAGLLVGGWVAGAMARHSGRFHGALTGLALATLIVIVARIGGSPAATLSVVLVFPLSAVISGTTGWLAGRRKSAAS